MAEVGRVYPHGYQGRDGREWINSGVEVLAGLCCYRRRRPPAIFVVGCCCLVRSLSFQLFFMFIPLSLHLSYLAPSSSALRLLPLPPHPPDVRDHTANGDPAVSS